jgi:hypothetical protein
VCNLQGTGSQHDDRTHRRLRLWLAPRSAGRGGEVRDGMEVPAVLQAAEGNAAEPGSAPEPNAEGRSHRIDEHAFP